MKKVKNIYYNDQEETGTGLFIELENGAIYRHQSSDSLIQFERIKELPK